MEKGRKAPHRRGSPISLLTGGNNSSGEQPVTILPEEQRRSWIDWNAEDFTGRERPGSGGSDPGSMYGGSHPSLPATVAPAQSLAVYFAEQDFRGLSTSCVDVRAGGTAGAEQRRGAGAARGSGVTLYRARHRAAPLLFACCQPCIINTAGWQLLYMTALL